MTTPFTVKTVEDFKSVDESFDSTYVVAVADTYETLIEKNESGILNSAYVYNAGGADLSIKITIDNVVLKEYTQSISGSHACGMIQTQDLYLDTIYKTISSGGDVQVLPTTSQIDKCFSAVKFNNLKIEVKSQNTASFLSYYNLKT